jgi:hypothetical protein
MNIPSNVSISIDLNKIDEQYIVNGKNGARYIDLKWVNTPTSAYGNAYFVSQQLPKAVRDEVKASGGEYPKTAILGNAKAWGLMDGKPAGKAATKDESDSGEMPF